LAGSRENINMELALRNSLDSNWPNNISQRWAPGH
jgi:hypothetical protein